MPRWLFVRLLCLSVAFPAFCQQPIGGLTGRIVFTSAGHGWTFSNSSGKWYTQRGDNNDIVEDYGNLDQMNMFVAYCFNAGATVVAFRPVGFQTDEVVLDNDTAVFSGSWSVSAATSGYYGDAGDAEPYRFANVAATETATATYTPSIPATGFYPVYTWASHGVNRTSQLYRVRHSGGEAQVRVPHNMVGSGWVYLGTYYFYAGSNALSGAVVISNLRATTNSTGVVIADAMRFGNGMGDVVPENTSGGASTISGHPREEECSRYWVQRMVGVGGPTSVYDSSTTDDNDNVSAPPRMAAHMNRSDVGSMFQRIFISFHSNAGGGRGTLALHNTPYPGTFTPNQLRLAQIVGREVNDDLVALTVPPYEAEWYDRGTSVTYSQTFAFGEINNSYINDAFDAIILEVGFHDSVDDALLLRDPKVRNVAARATYQAVIRYMNEFDALPLVFLPEPPANVRVSNAGDGRMLLRWDAPPSGGGAATGFVVYGSTNGYGFAPLGGARGGAATSLTLSNLAADTDWYFRVASTNAAGESLPSAVVGCRVGSSPTRVLFVNAFDRYDRTLDVRQTAGPGIGGPNGGTATFDRIKPRLINSFDYVVQHGRALSKNGVAFDSCENEAVANGQIALSNYAAVIWAAGQESTANETFNAVEQGRMTNFIRGGGHLFVSGSEIAWDLDRDSGPTAADRAFLNNFLHADLGGNTNDSSETYIFFPAANSIFSGNPTGRFDDGTAGIYNVQYPDRLTPVGSQPCLSYSGGHGTAGLQFADPITGSKLVYLGFPFETITSELLRERYMFDVLKFFELLPQPEIVSIAVDSGAGAVQVSWTAIPGKRYRVQYTDSLLPANWVDLPGDVTATSSTETRTDLTASGTQRFYRVLLLD